MFASARLSLSAALAALAACASSASPPPSTEPASRPLTAGEAEARIAVRVQLFSDCYRKNRLRYGLEAPASYVLRLRIPASDGPKVATVQEATAEGQEELERCLIEVLEGTQFRAAPAEPLVLDVPIRAPDR